MPSRVIEGGCLCSAVRYRVTGTPIVTSLCHCRTCRLAAGAPSVAWVIFSSSDFMFSTGQPARFRSSPGVVRTFCSRCGTSLTYQRDAEPDTVDVTTASLDSPDEFAPTREIWIAHKLAWERLNDTLPQYPESSRQG
jgi:hypothetical protein